MYIIEAWVNNMSWVRSSDFPSEYFDLHDAINALKARPSVTNVVQRRIVKHTIVTSAPEVAALVAPPNPAALQQQLDDLMRCQGNDLKRIVELEARVSTIPLLTDRTRQLADRLDKLCGRLMNSLGGSW